MESYRKNSGFTLIEVIIYIGLFSIIIGGGMVAAYGIIEGTDAGSNKIVLQEEANFLLRKINWALTGATLVNVSGTRLESTKEVGGVSKTFSFNLCGDNLTIEEGAGRTCANSPIILNSSSIEVAATTLFIKTTGSGKPDAITTNFTLTTTQNGRNSSQIFSTTKYLRK